MLHVLLLQGGGEEERKGLIHLIHLIYLLIYIYIFEKKII